jgi:hypothetical protein
MGEKNQATTAYKAAMEVLVCITGLALIFGVICVLIVSIPIGLAMVGFGIIMLIVTLITRAALLGQRRQQH